jgi:hypothetical protein
MAEKKVVTAASTTTAAKTKGSIKTHSAYPLFETENYMWMGIGAVIIAIGMFLLSGGKSPNPNQFDTKLVYSTTRITVAPILIIVGLLVEIYAIFKRPKAHQ